MSDTTTSTTPSTVNLIGAGILTVVSAGLLTMAGKVFLGALKGDASE